MEKIRKIRKESIVLVVLPSKDYGEVTSTLVEHLSSELQFKGIYLTFSKPYEALKNIFDDRGINTNGIFFIMREYCVG